MEIQFQGLKVSWIFSKRWRSQKRFKISPRQGFLFFFFFLKGWKLLPRPTSINYLNLCESYEIFYPPFMMFTIEMLPVAGNLSIILQNLIVNITTGQTNVHNYLHNLGYLAQKFKFGNSNFYYCPLKGEYNHH